jgi:hypothetical protein
MPRQYLLYPEFMLGLSQQTRQKACQLEPLRPRLRLRHLLHRLHARLARAILHPLVINGAMALISTLTTTPRFHALESRANIGSN